MRNIIAARIDERLIHGQVMTAWMRLYAPNSILIVDAVSAANTFLSRILFAAAPKDIELNVMNEADAEAFLKEPAPASERLMILAKTPAPFLSLIESGLSFGEIILGNMGGASDRKRFNKNISASEKEVEDFRKIVEAGVPIYCQMVPTDSKESITNLL
ncbi:PTS sugar transporter subunit IIB [uncultured Olegusella sp.]|uniref:PTS sugar transporter subunit IIB n=1 Tax=uncultured Olegusella sp. TaxID=1979846 RepID=UPI0026385C6A|nr:PTS sugar transporter subunit IIB [uncultured Olegusella sp.]